MQIIFLKNVPIIYPVPLLKSILNLLKIDHSEDTRI